VGIEYGEGYQAAQEQKCMQLQILSSVITL